MTRKRTTENELSMSAGSASAPRRKASRLRPVRSAVAPEPVETAPAPVASSATIAETLAPVAAPAHQDIALLAFSYWEARGCQGGSPEEDWLRAEGEIRRLSTVVL